MEVDPLFPLDAEDRVKFTHAFHHISSDSVRLPVADPLFAVHSLQAISAFAMEKNGPIAKNRDTGIIYLHLRDNFNEDAIGIADYEISSGILAF